MSTGDVNRAADEAETLAAEAPSGIETFQPWLDAFLQVARHYRCDFSEENVRVATAWEHGANDPDRVLQSIARQLGLSLRIEHPPLNAPTPWRLPLVVELSDRQVAVLESIDGDAYYLAFPQDQGLSKPLPRDRIEDSIVRILTLRPARTGADPRVDEYVAPYREHWFREIVLRDLRPYGHVMVASLLANTLSLAGLLFAMQVYDRVIPAESFPTLYVLFSGVVLALTFELTMRVARVRLIDVLGKRADLRLSDRIFGHSLRLKNTVRPRSTGTFINQIREIERVREMMTSTTVSVLADMPFFVLFLFVFWYLAGPLALIPLLGLLVLVTPGLLSQRRLNQLAHASMRESSLRNALLVESVQGVDDIKSLQAEPRFQNQWNHYNTLTTDTNLQLRFLTNSLTAWSQTVQTGVFAVVILFGAPMAMTGDLTTGALVAASILASRMLVPMAQLNQLLSRWQHARIALSGLDQIMARPVDHPEGDKRVHRPALNGHYRFRDAAFRYSAEEPGTALQVQELTVRPGERIAVLGRNGAGKSTLLQALSGLLEPSEGQVLLDGVRLAHLDPADVRRDVGLLTQNARLFHGTVRENLTLGIPGARDEALLETLTLVGAREMLNSLSSGLDHVVQEGGQGLSGGQRQALLLARLMLREPRIALLDEPTTALDEASERQVITSLGAWSQGRTLVVATHRRSVLELVDRIIVVDRGRIVLDDSKKQALARLASGTPARPNPGTRRGG
ncbi:ABC transporter related protein [Thioalkalivibrio nitratireducens DSM 14787]|uniref:ABC transporter related protein n=1 Tax=Thioalkalivibrio nitratireducens (strain DSM 14787 / UNIQEM 213 / ALEN2) TaxID=1255043 RepID=L0DVM2_THIND|nr:type I secretion system permease/ATPase [Thioalkalivibrio nitratireducens]AGA33654.1 ABC transporter related protein [Thioalkalivibrio nitratireducens DSM 14787]